MVCPPRREGRLTDITGRGTKAELGGTRRFRPMAWNPGRITVAIAVAIFITCLAPAVATASPGGRMIAGINHARAQHGVRALHASGSLSRSATRYSKYMLKRDYFGHMSRI